LDYGFKEWEGLGTHHKKSASAVDAAFTRPRPEGLGFCTHTQNLEDQSGVLHRLFNQAARDRLGSLSS
jgi:hypothetical protein